MPPVSLFYFLFLSAQSLGHRGHKNTFFRRLIISQMYMNQLDKSEQEMSGC